MKPFAFAAGGTRRCCPFPWCDYVLDRPSFNPAIHGVTPRDPELMHQWAFAREAYVVEVALQGHLDESHPGWTLDSLSAVAANLAVSEVECEALLREHERTGR